MFIYVFSMFTLVGIHVPIAVFLIDTLAKVYLPIGSHHYNLLKW